MSEVAAVCTPGLNALDAARVLDCPDTADTAVYVGVTCVADADSVDEPPVRDAVAVFRYYSHGSPFPRSNKRDCLFMLYYSICVFANY